MMPYNKGDWCERAIAVKLPLLAPWWHAVFEWLAYFSAFRYMAILRRSDSLCGESRNWVIGACILGAALGSKVVVWLDNPTWFFTYWRDPMVLMTAGKGIGGALVGGLLGVEIFKYFLGIKRSTGDLFVYPLILAITIGRIGCFLTGFYDHTYGTVTTLPWAVDFGDGLLRHPTQLYEILFLSALGVYFYTTRTVSRPEGKRFQIFMFCYFIFRFAVEFIKPVPHAFWGLNGTQLLSLAIILYYAPGLLGLTHPLGFKKANLRKQTL